MITATEIRIGNAIWDDVAGKVRFVTHRIISDIASSAESLPYSPIPLNAEWLVKFGFVESKSYDSKQRNFKKEGFNQLADYGGQIIILPEGGFASVSCGYYENQIDCPYVHQLQNLYFALTGEELTIKETV